MIDLAIRTIKRLIVLIPGLIVAFFSARDIFPYLDKRIPASLAVLSTYVIAAYVLVPSLMRVIRFFIKPSHIPLYSTTPDGFASDPINVGLVGTEKQVIRAMKKAGWYRADKRTPHTVMKLVIYSILKHPYPTAPFSNLYLFGRSHDLGFELPVDDNPRHRHHVRFWAASHTGDPEHLEHLTFWERFHRTKIKDRVLWVGAASLDTGLGIIRHNAQITHMIHHDTNAERDLIVRHLRATNLVGKCQKVKIGNAYHLTNRVLTGYMLADGKITICELFGLLPRAKRKHTAIK